MKSSLKGKESSRISTPSKTFNRRDLESESSGSLNYRMSKTSEKFITPNIQDSPSKNSAFTSNVHEFIKQSAEIQDDLRKLSKICNKIYPKHGEDKTPNTGERNNWTRANGLLLSLGYPQLILENGKVPYDVLAESYMQLLNDFFYQNGIFEENQEVLASNEKEIECLIEEIKFLKQSYNKNSSKNFENEVKELEKITQCMEAKILKIKQKIKEKDAIIKELRTPFGFDPILNNLDASSNQKFLRIFQGFLHRSFKETSKSDIKIMSIIEHYESHSESISHQVILDELEVQSSNEALSLISQLKQESFIYKETEKVILEIYYMLFAKPISGNLFIKYETVYEELLNKICETSVKLKQLEDFKVKIFLALNAKKNCELSEVIEKAETVDKIRKLFQIDDDRNFCEKIEKLFYFVHEMKGFLKKIREVIGKEMSVEGLIDEVMIRIG